MDLVYSNISHCLKIQHMKSKKNFWKRRRKENQSYIHVDINLPGHRYSIKGTISIYCSKQILSDALEDAKWQLKGSKIHCQINIGNIYSIRSYTKLGQLCLAWWISLLIRSLQSLYREKLTQESKSIQIAGNFFMVEISFPHWQDNFSLNWPLGRFSL